LGALLPAATHAGTPGFAFLEIPTGARAAAMGGAYASLASGAEAIFWNPAGLELSHGIQLAGGHSELYQNLRHDYFSLSGRLFGGGIATSVRALYTEPIEERDDLGNLIGSFGAHDLELALGYARSVGGGISWGASAQVLRERISNLGATTYAFNLGAAWEPEAVPGLRASASALNMGPAARYTIDDTQGEPVPLPTALQTGVAYRLSAGTRFQVNTALEARVSRGRDPVTLIGAELADRGGAALRLGVRVNDSASTMSFGAGYAFPSLRLDYAFVPMNSDLGDTHRFAFSTQF
jgi:hypothetical protein